MLHTCMQYRCTLKNHFRKQNRKTYPLNEKCLSLINVNNYNIYNILNSKLNNIQFFFY